mmetsp:Transcript_31059/g.47382  ORF Transcript_31059/g.47382 Transcript_31059/m.47382 type:complete len:218 (-) Transcript_31059:266-919(-)
MLPSCKSSSNACCISSLKVFLPATLHCAFDVSRVSFASFPCFLVCFSPNRNNDILLFRLVTPSENMDVSVVSFSCFLVCFSPTRNNVILLFGIVPPSEDSHSLCPVLRCLCAKESVSKLLNKDRLLFDRSVFSPNISLLPKSLLSNICHTASSISSPNSDVRLFLSRELFILRASSLGTAFPLFVEVLSPNLIKEILRFGRKPSSEISVLFKSSFPL